jgi:superfamily I DNA/RNA helicase
LSYAAIRSALETSDPKSFLGTYEFYPEEGKYHVDGHRKCGFRSSPQQTKALENLCPVCGKPLTLGVLYRVESLADRPEGSRSPRAASFRSLIPLEDILSEVLRVGPKSKKVLQAGHRLIRTFGSELDILCRVPREDLERCGISLLAEAIERMRDGRVKFDPGYDGEFGQVRIFDPEERRALQGQQKLFDVPCHTDCGSGADPIEHAAASARTQHHAQLDFNLAEGSAAVQLNPQQQAVVDHSRGPLCIVAGPGTGKTRTITCRMAALIRQGIDTILAVTFTNKAAEEMRRRLAAMQADHTPDDGRPLIATFHGLCRQLLQEVYDHCFGAIVDDQGRTALLADALALSAADGRTITFAEADLLELIVEAKQRLLSHDDDLSPLVSDYNLRRQLAEVYGRYQTLLKLQELFDFEDLILETVKVLESDATWRKTVQKRFSHIFVDEFQDINFGQYRLLRALTAKEGQVCVIGDPDQAIYGFRGSDVRYFQHFSHDYQNVRLHQLNRNYRSSTTILEASFQLMQGHRIPLQTGERTPIRSDISGVATIAVMETASSKAEAVAIGRTIEQLVGGIGFHSLDFEKLDVQTAIGDSSFDDFAVLCRTGEQAQFIAQTLMTAGIPCQLASSKMVDEKTAAKLLAALKVVKGVGTYADFSRLMDLGGSPISRETLDIFKLWAYAKQLPLTTALHAVNRFPVPGLTTKRQQRLAALVRLLETLRRRTAEMSLPQSLACIVEQTRLSRQLESRDLEALMALADPFHDQADAFAATLALRKDTDYYHGRIEKVAVMTLHAAKGLEFSTVFVAGCEDGLIPYRRPDREEVDLDEERRLFYVGMTRARDRLILSWARKRTRFGKSVQTRISPFLGAISPQLLEYQTPQSMS